MKTLLTAITLLGIFSCTHRKKSDEIASYPFSSELKLSKVLDDRVGSWIEEGLECYGIVSMCDNEGNLLAAKTIKAKTLIITEKAIKMKALETVNLAPKDGCNKLGLEEKETWWENKGDLFRTREEAIVYVETLIAPKVQKKDGCFIIN